MTTKRRLEIKPNSDVHEASTRLGEPAVAGVVKVVDQEAGAVGFLDKAKGYYHTIITVIGAVLVLLNEVTPVTNFLPPTQRGWISVGIVFLTALANFLKSNEQWVDDL